MISNEIKKTIIVAIPAYNEEENILGVVSKASLHVNQVIVIDDGSTDKSAELAKKGGAVVLAHDINKGKGIALNTALEYVKKSNADILVFLDGDGQHNPEEIPIIIEQVLNGHADLVIGSRFLASNYIPKYRLIGQKILNMFTNFGCGIKVSDSQSGFRALSRKAIDCFSFTERGLAVESEMQFLAAKYKLNIKEVPITTNYNNELKRSPVIHGFSVLFRVLGLIKKYFLNRRDVAY